MTKQTQYERLLTTKEAAAFLGMSPAFLERDRCEGRTIPFVRIGTHRVRYSLSELEAYIQQRSSHLTRKRRSTRKQRKQQRILAERR